MVVAVFFPDISQFSVDSPLSEAYPPSKHGCPLPNTCWVIGLQASTLFSEEVCLLGQHHLLVITSSRPRPNNLLAFTHTCLSSDSLASLGATHNPIPLSEPFIPTLFILNLIDLKLKAKLTCKVNSRPRWSLTFIYIVAKGLYDAQFYYKFI